MLLYFSKNKAEDLVKELDITANAFESIFRYEPRRILLGGSNGVFSGKVELSKGDNQATYNIRSVLRTLKTKGKLVELCPNTPIKQLTYIHSRGTLEYLKFKDGYTASRLSKDDLDKVRTPGEFFEDDFLYFRLNIGHEQYDKIIVECTARNMAVFGGNNLQILYPDLFKGKFMIMYPHSDDPGILYKKIEAEFIISIHDTNQNDRSILGSPIVIYTA